MAAFKILTLAIISTTIATTAAADYGFSSHSIQQSQSIYQHSNPINNFHQHNTRQGNAIAATEQRALPAFERIRLEIPAEVTYQQSIKSQLGITADSNLLAIIGSEVVDGVLVIDAAESFSSTLPIQISLNSEALVGITMTGSGQINVKNLNTPSLHLKINGSGQLKLTGRSTELNSNLIGSGFIDGSQLESQYCRLSLQGSGGIESLCDTHVSAQLLGSGTIAVDGSPASRQLSGWGAGQILVN